MNLVSQKLYEILKEKEEKIVPENIKEGVQVFDITGNYISAIPENIEEQILQQEQTIADIQMLLTNKSKGKFNTKIELGNTNAVSDLRHFMTDVILDTSNITNMSGMFQSFTNLRAVPPIVMNNITSTSSMLSGCSNLVRIPKLDLNHVSSADYMFSSCANLVDVPDLYMPNLVFAIGMF